MEALLLLLGPVDRSLQLRLILVLRMMPRRKELRVSFHELTFILKPELQGRDPGRSPGLRVRCLKWSYPAPERRWRMRVVVEVCHQERVLDQLLLHLQVQLKRYLVEM